MEKRALVLFLFLGFISCTKETGVAGPSGPQGPSGAPGAGAASDTGSIAGRINLLDEFSFGEGTAGGAIVTLTSGSLHLTDTTNGNGQYQFRGIKTGTYELSYQKAGFGTMKVFGVSHFGGGAIPTSVMDVDLIQIPAKTAPDSLGIVVNNGNFTTFLISLDTSSLNYVEYYLNFEIFISTDKNVSSSNYSYEIESASPDGSGGYDGFLSKSNNPIPVPFHYGDTLFAIAYTLNRYIHVTNQPSSYYNYIGDGGVYIDPQTGKIIYPNLSPPSKTLKFVY